MCLAETIQCNLFYEATQARACTLLGGGLIHSCKKQPENRQMMLMLRMLTRVLSFHLTTLTCLALALAAGARQQTETIRTIVDGVDLDVPLATFFLDVQAPHISIQEDKHGLPQNRTRVHVEISRSRVPAHMPVITSSLQPGLVHNVVHTWDWLQKYAELHARIKQRHRARAQMRYPIPGVASLASSALHPKADVPDTLGTVITRQEEQHLRWMHKAAASAILMLPGQAGAAVADVHHLAAAENGQDSVVLTLDIVHQPFTFSEFVEHGLQYYDERSHYHFHAPAGIELDAAKFLANVEEARGAPTGLFVFIKGLPEDQWFWHLAPHIK